MLVLLLICLTVPGGIAEAEVLQYGGFIESPNHPGSLPTSATQSVYLQAPVGMTILVHFEKLDLGCRRTDGGTCSFTVEMLDGNTSSSRSLAQLTTGNQPRDVQSTGRLMLFRLFPTTSATQGTTGSGYYAVYEFTTLQQNFTGKGEISTPDYPLDYPANQLIQWRVHSTPNNFIRVIIDDMDLEECCDSLSILDGDFVDAEVHAVLSGTMQIPYYDYMSGGPNYLLRFRSNGAIAGRGAHILYITGKVIIIGAATGDVSPSTFPEPYPAWHCDRYYIRLPSPNFRVYLEFKVFDMQENSDFVQIRDGNNVSSPIVASYTGSTLPPPFLSTSNSLIVEFKAGGVNTSLPGFFATFTAVPSDFITTTTTTTGAPLCLRPGFYRLPYEGFCDQYIQCLNYQHTIESCPPGLWFDPEVEECNIIENVSCPWGPTTSTEAPLCPPEGIVYIPVPGDCSTYILCADGEPSQRRCPEGTLFNPINLRCDLADNVVCLP